MVRIDTWYFRSPHHNEISARELVGPFRLSTHDETTAEVLQYGQFKKHYAQCVLEPHLFEKFVVTLAFVPLPLLNATSGNPSSVLAACMIPKGLIRTHKKLR